MNLSSLLTARGGEGWQEIHSSISVGIHIAFYKNASYSREKPFRFSCSCFINTYTDFINILLLFGPGD